MSRQPLSDQGDPDPRAARPRGDAVPVSINWDYNCLVLGTEDTAELVGEAKAAGLDQINFRISNNK